MKKAINTTIEMDCILALFPEKNLIIPMSVNTPINPHIKRKNNRKKNKSEFTYEKWYCTKLGGTGIRWLNQHVIELHIRPITSSTQPIVSQIESLVDAILSAKKDNPAADTSAFEQQIDYLVYRLYDLTEEEIKIVEGVSNEK